MCSSDLVRWVGDDPALPRPRPGGEAARQPQAVGVDQQLAVAPQLGLGVVAAADRREGLEVEHPMAAVVETQHQIGGAGDIRLPAGEHQLTADHLDVVPEGLGEERLQPGAVGQEGALGHEGLTDPEVGGPVGGRRRPAMEAVVLEGGMAGVAAGFPDGAMGLDPAEGVGVLEHPGDDTGDGDREAMATVAAAVLPGAVVTTEGLQGQPGPVDNVVVLRTLVY